MYIHMNHWGLCFCQYLPNSFIYRWNYSRMRASILSDVFPKNRKILIYVIGYHFNINFVLCCYWCVWRGPYAKKIRGMDIAFPFSCFSVVQLATWHFFLCFSPTWEVDLFHTLRLFSFPSAFWYEPWLFSTITFCAHPLDCSWLLCVILHLNSF